MSGPSNNRRKASGRRCRSVVAGAVVATTAVLAGSARAGTYVFNTSNTPLTAQQTAALHAQYGASYQEIDAGTAQTLSINGTTVRSGAAGVNTSVFFVAGDLTLGAGDNLVGIGTNLLTINVGNNAVIAPTATISTAAIGAVAGAVAGAGGGSGGAGGVAFRQTSNDAGGFSPQNDPRFYLKGPDGNPQSVYVAGFTVPGMDDTSYTHYLHDFTKSYAGTAGTGGVHAGSSGGAGAQGSVLDGAFTDGPLATRGGNGANGPDGADQVDPFGPAAVGGYGGGVGVTGGSGTKGVGGTSGAGAGVGTDNGTLRGGSGGGGGASGGSGLPGAYGGDGGNGGSGGRTFLGYQSTRRQGGAGGPGGSGGVGGFGGDGATGGGGGGGLELFVNGQLTINGNVTSAGGDGPVTPAGLGPVAGQVGAPGGAGQAGQAGTPFFETDGGAGGNGGQGGNGGDGGAGGLGGPGSGGDVHLIASKVTGAGTYSSLGGAYTGSKVRAASGAVHFNDFDAGHETDTSVTAAGAFNPYVSYAAISNSRVANTPALTDVAGGAWSFGRLVNVNGSDNTLPYQAVTSTGTMPQNFVGSVLRGSQAQFDRGVSYDGYDLLTFVAVHDLTSPALAVANAGDMTQPAGLVPLRTAGWTTDPNYTPGATGPVTLSTLASHQAFATLVAQGKPFDVTATFTPYAKPRSFTATFSPSTGRLDLYDYGLPQIMIRYPRSPVVNATYTQDGDNTDLGTALQFDYREGSGEQLFDIQTVNVGHSYSLLSGSMAFDAQTQTFTQLAGNQGSEVLVPVLTAAARGTSEAHQLRVLTNAGGVSATPVLHVVGPNLIPAVDFPTVGSGKGSNIDYFLINSTDPDAIAELTDLDVLGVSIVNDPAHAFSISRGLTDTRLSGNEVQDMLVAFAGQSQPGVYTATLRVQTDQDAALLASGRTFDFDLKVTVTPEPSMLGVLCLGATALSRRRRRAAPTVA